MSRPDIEGISLRRATVEGRWLTSTEADEIIAYTLELETQLAAQEDMYQMVERLTDQLRNTENNLDSSARRIEESNQSLRSALDRARDSMSSLWLALQNRR